MRGPFRNSIEIVGTEKVIVVGVSAEMEICDAGKGTAFGGAIALIYRYNN